MAESRKATRTQESNVLNLKLLISRFEIADTLVTLLYARQHSVSLLGLCSYAVGSILCRQGHTSRHVSRRRGAIRGALRGDENDCTKSFCISNNLLFSNPRVLLYRQTGAVLDSVGGETRDENYHEIRLFNRPH